MTHRVGIGTILSLLACPALAAAQQPHHVAIIGVNVIPMNAVGILADQTVIIRDSLIERIGPSATTAIPAEAERIEGEGKYLLPGLIDMHVHLFDAAELPFYVQSGITTVRNMWGWKLHLELDEQVRRGELPGPDIVTTGELLDGDPPQLRGSAIVRGEADADSIVQRMAATGFTSVKVYNRLTPEAYHAILVAAKRHGLPVVGHVPTRMGIYAVLDGDQASIEHLTGVLAAVSADTGRATWSSRINPARLDSLADRIARSGTVMVPTLVTMVQGDLTAAEQASLMADSRVARLPAGLKRFCCSRAGDAADDLTAPVRATRQANRSAVVRAIVSSGGTILVGTDTGNPFVIPGDAYHEELALLQSAGLRELALLRAATLDAARFLGLEKVGAVAPGFRADLLLVDGNPLQNPALLRRPAAVMARGRWAALPH